MPRSRGSEAPQRPSPRGPHPFRTSSSDSDSQRHRPTTERSPKIGDRGNPKDPNSVNQKKKLGTRIADLESQLGQAQAELKVLKEQVSSAEVAKMEAQKQRKKKDKKPVVPEPEENPGKNSPLETSDSPKRSHKIVDEASEDIEKETDVFEVPVEEKAVEPETEKPSSHEMELKAAEISTLKAKLLEKDNELEFSKKENESFRTELSKAISDISCAKTKEDEMSLRISQQTAELEASKANADHLNDKLNAAEKAKEALEAEMKTMKIQTEQWRKAADAAAAMLAGGGDMNGGVSRRCGSMDKHFDGIFETPADGYCSFPRSPRLAEDFDDNFKSVKPKGSGIKVLGDIWRKMK